MQVIFQKANGRKIKPLIYFVLLQLIKLLTAFIGNYFKNHVKRAPKIENTFFILCDVRNLSFSCIGLHNIYYTELCMRKGLDFNNYPFNLFPN